MKGWLLVVAAALSLGACGGAASSTSSDAGATAPVSSSTDVTGIAPSPSPSPEAPSPSPLSPSAVVTPAAVPPPPTAVVTSAPAVPGVARPNPGYTPGEVFAAATSGQVCTSGYSSSVRHVTSAQYHEVYAEYGIAYPEPTGTYELDHLIPLELGGDNANANLWPEPASPTPGFHQKDSLENAMHSLVCSGRLDLHEAQHEIASDWYAAYLRYVGG